MTYKIRDAIRLVESEGWYLARTRGSHRHYKHPDKPGVVTVAGHPKTDVPPRIWNSILRQMGLR